MAKTNRGRVEEIMDLLKSGLGAYLRGHLPPDFDSEMDTASLDAHALLKLMFNHWNAYFRDTLGHNERSYVSELMTARNRWAHQEPFTNEQTQRAADTAKLLLEAVNATDEAGAAAAISNGLLRIRYERQADSAARRPQPAADAQRTTDATLKPWRQVIEPHADVRSGRFLQAEFAADLAAVMRGEAAPEYQEARPFFERTYMTEGLRDLVVNGIKRLTGAGGDPVVQLQTNFGGGKTHSMLALYHAFGDGFKLRDLRDFDEIQQRVSDIDDDIRARRAVIVGTSFNVSQPRQHPDCTTRAIWGEIAYQLGGLAGYELVEPNDLEGTNPGADTLVQLMESHGPALIILDELVRLSQNVYRVEPAPAAGSFEAILAFMQSLTEAVKRTSDALLLVSIPASDIETGGEGGRTTLEKLSQTLGRVESVWKPVSTAESYEIVRRRLFNDVADFPARDAVINAFQRMYGDSRADFPQDAPEGEYRAKMRQAYPIHPELFERLYEDWSTLERFQRTRGVLRMMASAIHRLWIDGDQSLMIMPGSIPLWNKSVESEITKYLLPRNFSPVVEADIDGTRSKPYQIDQDVKQLGKHSASRRVARAIFMGSSPAKQIRGIEERRINLATVQPGERAGVFGDALRRLSNQLTYLYFDGRHYWYDTRATVNRTAEDRAAGVDEHAIHDEAAKRLKAQQWDKRALGFAHIMPEGSAEIPDEPSARVVVLAPEYTHKHNDLHSAALAQIGGQLKADGKRDGAGIMDKRGNAPRHHRNMLIFIAPDDSRCAEWQDSIRKYLAWVSILDDVAQLNLDQQQIEQVKNAIERESQTVNEQMQQTYCWLIVPRQPDPKGDVIYAAERIRLSDNFLEGAARKLKSNEWLIDGLSPDNLLLEIEPYHDWQAQPHLRLKTLWEWLTKYCYLQRVLNYSVLEATISDGVSRMFPAFAYATGIDDEGKYSGLTMARQFTLYLDDKALIVAAQAAQKQLDAERAAIERVTVAPPVEDTGMSSDASALDKTDDPPAPKPKRRYYGSAQVDAQSAMRDLSQIAAEVIARLAELPGAEVTITVEIEGWRAAGFDEAAIRALSENSRTLNFKSHGFED